MVVARYIAHFSESLPVKELWKFVEIGVLLFGGTVYMYMVVHSISGHILYDSYSTMLVL